VGGPTLEKESAILPINLFLEKLIANNIRRNHSSAVGRNTREICAKIRRRHPASRQQIINQKSTPLRANTNWLRKKIPEEIFSREVV